MTGINDTSRTRYAVRVVTAGLVVTALTLSLGVRLMAKSGDSRASKPAIYTSPPPPPPPAAHVPAPRLVDAAELPTPYCWTCNSGQLREMKFHVDLDLLAPLGDGTANAALWMRAFAKSDGSRLHERWDRRMIRADVGGEQIPVLPGDDPLLLEAEPWIDQARCSFYPDVWKVSGPDMPIPNLLHSIVLARSWIARGNAATDPIAKREDYRRAIRMGRLLWQDHATLLQDLVALACIRMGAEALYETARDEGDCVLMTVASLAISDSHGIRQAAAEQTTRMTMLMRRVQDGWFGPSLDVTEDEVESTIRAARKAGAGTVRAEAIFALYTIEHTADDVHRKAASAALDELAHNEDDTIAALASWTRATPFSDSFLEMITK